MHATVKRTVFGVALLCLTAGPLAAQTGDDKLETLLDELDALIDKGEAQNLADPWFLQDLRALAERYGQTWPVVLLDHRFDSKDALPKAPWTVSQGEMKMDWSRGLRSRVEAAAAAQAEEPKSDKEVAAAIIGGILNQALGGQQQQGGQTAKADPSVPALARAAVPISNAFQIQAEISARALPGAEEGALELGVYQSGDAGYRLALVPTAAGGAKVTLLAVSSRGTSRVIETAAYAQTITDDKPLTVTLSRKPDGMMAVALGGQALFAARDQSFRDPFAGILIANRGGDYAVKWMTVRGTK